MSYPHAQSGKSPLPPFAKGARGDLAQKGGQSPPLPVPIFMMQHLLSDELENGHALPCGVGTLPFFFSRRLRATAQKGTHGCLPPPKLVLIRKTPFVLEK